MQQMPWFVHAPAAPRRMRLYCFAFAGGGAAVFAPWRELVSADIEIRALQLPGRAERWGERPFTEFGAMLDGLAAAFAGQPAGEFAFFGHSLGALIAFELARRLRDGGRATPRRVFVSGCAAPRCPSRPVPSPLLDDAALIGELRRLNGTPPELLEHRDLMELMLPTIRADFALVRSYRYAPGVPLDVPLTVLAGLEDDGTGAEQVAGWQAETTAPADILWFLGDHFFIDQARRDVVATVNAALAPAACPGQAISTC